MPNTRIAEAPAKVNLFLRVLGARPDGYHEIETLIAPISLEDRLEVHADADPSFRTLSLSLEVTGDPGLVRGVPNDESNLVIRAASALADRAGVRGFADITLEKRIPAAAGLGGGSSDAAATLKVLNDLWDCGLDERTLLDVGASIGSDVPALLMDGPAIARGRGDRVEAAKVSPLSVAVVTFPFGVSTRDAFAWWDEAHGTTGPDPSPLVEAALSGGEALGGLLFNDLEGVVVRRHPEIGEARRALLAGGAFGAVMSGSGPTVVGCLSPPGRRLEEDVEGALERISGRLPTYAFVRDRGA